MDTAAISSVVELLSTNVLTVGGMIAAWAWMLSRLRTRSSHMIMSRMWLLLSGKTACKVASIQELLDTQTGVMQFRFMTGISRARTVAQIERLILWGKEHDEDLADIAACGRYFDLEKPAPVERPKLPGKWQIGLIKIAALVVAVGIAFSVLGMLFDRALFTMRDTGTVFTLTEKSAKPFNDSPAIQLSNCPSLLGQREHPGFTDSDIRHICTWANQPDTNEYLAKTVRLQRGLSAFLGAYLCCLFVPAYRIIKCDRAVSDMRRRLETART